MPTAKAVRLRGIANWEWPKEFGLVCRRAPAIRSVAFCDSGAFRDTSLDAAPWQTSRACGILAPTQTDAGAGAV
jgi:hypothetical protein